jgi:hypothetical protein
MKGKIKCPQSKMPVFTIQKHFFALWVGNFTMKKLKKKMDAPAVYIPALFIPLDCKMSPTREFFW